MEGRLNKKIETHLFDFKNTIKNWFDDNRSTISGDSNISDFLKFIYDYDGLSLEKDDFQKRKRVKNIIPIDNRCCAKRANGQQCTRRKKDNCMYCGTHEKGLPYGIIDSEDKCQEVSKTKKVEIWIEEIKGIHYYIDSEFNVYNHDDILNNKKNPKIIAKYIKSENGVYTIPEFLI